jgi:hypothetical protein
MRTDAFVRSCRLLLFLIVASLIAFHGLAPASAHGQAIFAADSGPGASRVDLYGGYGYFRPFNSDIHEIPYEGVNAGGVFSVAGYFNRHLGVQLEGNFFPKGSNDNDCVYSAQLGPIFRLQKGRFVPFVHALGGAAKVGGPASQFCNVWGWGTTGGFGVDYILPILHDRVAFRPIQGDFSYSRIDNGPSTGQALGGVGEIYAYRLSAGLTLRLGNMQPRGGSTTLNCSAEPTPVYPGDPVTLTASTLNPPNSRRLRYTWEVSEGKVSGTGETATVDTAGLPPGDYTATGRLVDGKNDRLIDSCTAEFAIQAPPPPTITCSASRAAINSGDPVTITATASSPSGRPLTYRYTTTNGLISGDGPTALLSTNGTTPGAITVTCTVSDDKGQTASATASVVVATPQPPAPSPTTQGLCSLSFDRDRKRPDRVDNEAKGCLDDIALTLNRQPEAKLLMVGRFGKGETRENAAERVLNASDYLVKEKGIDRTRLRLRVGDIPGRSVSNTLIPPGVSLSLDRGGTSDVDPSRVRRHGEAYGLPRSSGVTRPTRRRPMHRRPVRRHRRSKTVLPPL